MCIEFSFCQGKQLLTAARQKVQILNERLIAGANSRAKEWNQAMVALLIKIFKSLCEQ